MRIAVEGSEIGVGTVIGSAVFNVTVGLAVVSVLAPFPMLLFAGPLLRDSAVYVACLSLILIFFNWVRGHATQRRDATRHDALAVFRGRGQCRARSGSDAQPSLMLCCASVGCVVPVFLSPSLPLTSPRRTRAWCGGRRC